MRIPRLERRGLGAFERAVRAGEPVFVGSLGSGLVADELVPLCHAVGDPALERWLPPPARPRPDLSVSVVIPTHRARPIGQHTLEAQDVHTEVLVLANGAWNEGIRVPWTGHGPTRNVGVALARHPYVLLTVDDALPLGAGFVRTLVEALESGGYDAVTARQVPWPTSDPVTRARLRAWTPPGPRAEPILDNVAALYRREALLADPFDVAEIAEDWLWGRRHHVGYVPAAVVAHAHPRNFRTLLERTRAIHRVRVDAGEVASVDALTMMRALPSVVGRDAPGALGELVGQWLGGRAPRRA